MIWEVGAWSSPSCKLLTFSDGMEEMMTILQGDNMAPGCIILQLLPSGDRPWGGRRSSF